MPDFFKTSSRAQDFAQGNQFMPLIDQFFLSLVLDTNVRKEAVMNSIRSELALLNVQDLINVRGFLYYARSA